MKTRNWPVPSVVLGALGVAFAACATQTEIQPPDTSGGGAFSSAGAGTTPAGTAGAPLVSSAGAPVTSFAGAPGASGAPSAAGAFGSSAGAPVVMGVAGSAAAGAPAVTGGCATAVGAATDLPIDDLEDGNNGILATGHRAGYWYTYNDGTAVQVPAPAAQFMAAMPGHGGMFAAHTSGPAFMAWGAGLGFDFNNTAMKSCPYNASAYAGIKFWAKGNVTLKTMVKIPATTLVASGGSCVATATGKCEDHFALTPAPALTAVWAQYTLDFANPTVFAQGKWGIPTTFDKANILAVQFQVDPMMAFDFSIDDVAFYTAP